MNGKTPAAILMPLALCALAIPVAATTVLQFGFDSTGGSVAVPINDGSGNGKHGTNLIHSVTAPAYSADIPTNTQFTTGVGSIDFTGTTAAISTAASAGAGGGQGILTASDIVTAGGMTMEVWIKNPADGTGNADPAYALNMAGMYTLGISGSRIGFFAGNNTANTDWSTDQFVADQWNHLAVVLSGPSANAQIYSNVSAYLNGTLINSVDNYNFTFFLDRATSIGNHQHSDWGNYDGLVYEPRVSLGALTTSQFTVVPEPSAALLGGIGLVALLRRRR